MAAGDVVNSIISGVAAGAAITFQPAAGVEALITCVGGPSGGTSPDTYTQIAIQLTDGTNNSAILSPDGNSKYNLSILKITINNSNYLRVVNTSAGSSNLAYGGFQTK